MDPHSKRLRRQLEISELVYHHGLIGVERLLEVHRTTIQRWCAGKIDVPISAIVALRAFKGDFPFMEAKSWAGWHFARDGKLYDPANVPHSEGDIRSLPYQMQLVTALRNQVAELEAKLAAAGVQPRALPSANHPYANPNHPVAALMEENAQLKQAKPRRVRR